MHPMWSPRPNDPQYLPKSSVEPDGSPTGAVENRLIQNCSPQTWSNSACPKKTPSLLAADVVENWLPQNCSTRSICGSRAWLSGVPLEAPKLLRHYSPKIGCRSDAPNILNIYSHITPQVLMWKISLQRWSEPFPNMFGYSKILLHKICCSQLIRNVLKLFQRF